MSLSLKSSTVVSFPRSFKKDVDSYDYVLQLDQTVDGCKLVAAVSNRLIHLHDINNLSKTQKLSFHQDTINNIETSNYNDNIIYSCSSDCSFCVWDLRVGDSPSSVLKMNSDLVAFSMGLSDTLLAVGVDSSIEFYDSRYLSSSKKLGEYADVHSDYITKLKFSGQQNNILTSAAEDGLITTFNTGVSAQEDAVLSIINTECPVQNFGFFGESREGIYAISTVETASIWHYPTAQRIGLYNNIRVELNVDYLVDCFNVDDNLYMVCGKYEGEGTLLEINPAQCRPFGSLPNGHVAMIRSCLYHKSGTVFTGGEDARICEWVNGISNGSISNSSANSSEIISGSHQKGITGKVKNSSSLDIKFNPYGK